MRDAQVGVTKPTEHIAFMRCHVWGIQCICPAKTTHGSELNLLGDPIQTHHLVAPREITVQS